MGEDFPITEMRMPEDAWANGVSSAAQFLYDMLTTEAIATHEGGFFVHILFQQPEQVAEYVQEVNKLLLEHDEIWRLESCVREPAEARLVLLFRAVDMHEALSC